MKISKIIIFILVVAICIVSIMLLFKMEKENDIDDKIVDRVVIDNSIEIIYEDNKKEISDIIKSTKSDARNSKNNYITFTLKRLVNKTINYAIVVKYGEDKQEVRYDDSLLRFDLLEMDNNKSTYLVDNKQFDSVNNIELYDDILNKNEKTYRLRVWLDEETKDENKYANIQVSIVIKPSEEEYVTTPMKASERVLKDALKNGCQDVFYEEDGIKYFSGSDICIDNNYVWYSGRMWRIVAIYPDGVMKLVTETSIQLNFGSNFADMNANNRSYAYEWLNEDFLSVLYNNENIIDDTKKWNDENYANYMPDEACEVLSNSTCLQGIKKPPENRMVSAKVGLLNAYEVGTTYKLLSPSILTQTPTQLSYSWLACMGFAGREDGIKYSSNQLLGGGYLEITPNIIIAGKRTLATLAPAINIKANIEFTGSGTWNDPYQITIDRKEANLGDYINTRGNGEYIKLVNDDKKVFRILQTENNTTKIAWIEPLMTTTTVWPTDNTCLMFARVTEKPTLDSSLIYGESLAKGERTIYSYLHDYWLPDLIKTSGDLFTYGTYYYGIVDTNYSDMVGLYAINYKESVCSKSDSNRKTSECQKTSLRKQLMVGLPIYGEMYDGGKALTICKVGYLYGIGACSDYLSRDHTHDKTYSTRCTNEHVQEGNGVVSNMGVITTPRVNLKSEVKILSGSGTKIDPYIVGL